jgi:hypothetical protein
MKALLRLAKVWDVVNETTTLGLDSAEYKEKSEEAYCIIVFTIEPSQFVYLHTITDNGVQAWKALKDVYIRKTRVNRVSLMRQLYNFKHDIAQPIDVYIRGILRLVWELRAIDVEMSDRHVTDILIMNLDDSWSTVKTMLMLTVPDDATVPDVQRLLLDHDELKALRERRFNPAPKVNNVPKGNEPKISTRGRKGHATRDRSNKGNGHNQENSGLVLSRDPYSLPF